MMNAKHMAAVIQMRSGDDRGVNLARAEHLMNEAADRGARLLVLPENFSFMGATEEEKRSHREDPEQGPSVTFLREFAKRRGLWIVGGSLPLATDDPNLVTNSCLLVAADGSVRARYDKIHLFDVNLGSCGPYQESRVIRPGKDVVVVDTPFGRLGLSICYDLRFPELYRRMTAEGAEILAVPAAFTQTTGKDHWELLVRARAVENFSFVLAADQWGRHPGKRRTFGHSMIVEPWGQVVARWDEGEGYAISELDPQRLTVPRRQIPCLSHRVL